MAEEELQLLRLVKAFVKIKDERRRLEIIELVEAAAEDYPESRIEARPPRLFGTFRATIRDNCLEVAARILSGTDPRLA